jgi:hypothetical protein
VDPPQLHHLQLDRVEVDVDREGVGQGVDLKRLLFEKKNSDKHFGHNM